MGYTYDAYFSYKRDRESFDWHRRFNAKLTYWLSQELGRPAQVFFDNEDIHFGDQWPATLAESLRRSRCLACIWSPLYFGSRWCMSEWLTFVQRERQLNARLVVPVRLVDGDHYPPLAKNVQSLDLRRFANTIPIFWETATAIDLEQTGLQPLARDLALRIQQAPPFDPLFPLHEAADDELTTQALIPRLADV